MTEHNKDFLLEHREMYNYYLSKGGTMTFEEWMDDMYPPLTDEDMEYINDLK